MAHIPVLQKEVIQYLNPKPNENFVDCTVGDGGHALAILEKNSPKGKVLGIDLSLTLKVKHPRLILVQGNFADLRDIVEKEKFKRVNGILLDLGMSSWHLEKSGRGFSFKRREPLDMRYSLQNNLTAEKIVNYWSKFDIEKILREYGEERRARRVAEKIIEARRIRPIEITWQLREIVNRAGAAPRKIFQALRIAVNDELDNLKKVLPQALEVLKSGDRLVIISFHSLEDRIVKNFFKEQDRASRIKLLIKKPVAPSREEIRINPRSRSAKLRAAIKT